MTWDITDRFPNWGESGESPPTGFFYSGGDQVNEKHLDYLWNSVKGLEDDVQSALDDIDSNADGKVDAADNADLATDATNVTSTYKGNDIDSNADGVVDKADLADSLTNFDEKAQDAVGTIISGSGGTTVTYDDANNSITVDSTSLTEEQVQDIVASLVSSDSNLSWSYDDPNDTLTISLADSISVATLEAADLGIVGGSNGSTLDLLDAVDLPGIAEITTQNTEDVSTSATAIIDSDHGGVGFLLVQGVNQSNASIQFFDRVADMRAGTDVATKNLINNNSPDGRTYAWNSNNDKIELQMSSGTYDIKVVAINLDQTPDS